MEKYSTQHPVLFVFILTVAWFGLLMVFMGIASSVLRKPYGDAIPCAISRLVVITFCLWLAWRLGWLEASGITRLGAGPLWLLALGGLVYFASASLFSFYGKIAFDFTSLSRLPAVRTAILSHLTASVCEEILFRGLALYVLIRAWGNSTWGILASVVFTALLFSILHLTQVFSAGISPSAVLILTLQAVMISIWWGALVVVGGSIWPAVMLHFVVNALVAVQGLTVPMVEPGIIAYQRLAWFSLPLAALGIGLLAFAGIPGLFPRVSQ